MQSAGTPKEKIKDTVAGFISSLLRRLKSAAAQKLHHWDSRCSPKERKWAFILFLGLGCSYCLAVLTKALFFEAHAASSITIKDPEPPPVLVLPPYRPRKDSLNHSRIN